MEENATKIVFDITNVATGCFLVNNVLRQVGCIVIRITGLNTYTVLENTIGGRVLLEDVKATNTSFVTSGVAHVCTDIEDFKTRAAQNLFQH